MFKVRRTLLFALFLTLTAFSAFAATNKKAEVAALRGKWLPISDEWEFYQSELLQSYEFYPEEKVPNGIKTSLPYTFQKGVHYGTFHCRVTGLSPRKNYATEIYGAIISSCRFWCNGRLVATSGFLSKDKRSARPGDLCEVVDLPADQNGVLDLVIHVADYGNEVCGIVKNLKMTEKRNASRSFHLHYFFNMLIFFFLLSHIIYNTTLLVLTFKRRTSIVLILLFILLAVSTLFTGISLTQKFLINMPFISHRRLPVSFFCLEAALAVIYESSYFRIARKKSAPMRVIAALNAALVFAAPPALFEKLHFLFSAVAIISLLVTISASSEFLTAKKTGDKNGRLKNLDLQKLRLLSAFIIVVACSYDFLAVAKNYTIIHSYLAFKVSILLFGIMECVVYSFNRDWTLSRVNRYAETLSNDNETLARFVSDQILKLMGASDITRIIPGECRIIDAVIFYAQIKRYNQMAESIGRRELFSVVSEFYQGISPIILDSGGFVAKRDSGGFIAIFQQKNTDAIICAARVQKKLREIRRKLRKTQRTDIDMGIAIHVGKVAIGTMGTNFRLDTTILSEDITIARAVANQNSKMNSQILITEEAMPYCRSYVDYMYEGHFFLFEGKQILVYSAMPIIKLENAYEETLEAIDDDVEEL